MSLEQSREIDAFPIESQVHTICECRVFTITDNNTVVIIYQTVTIQILVKDITFLRGSIWEYNFTFHIRIIQHRLYQSQVFICLNNTIYFANIQRPDRQAFLQHSCTIIRRIIPFELIHVIFDIGKVESDVIREIFTSSVTPVCREFKTFIGYLRCVLLGDGSITVYHRGRKVDQDAIRLLVKEFNTSGQTVS